MLEFASEMLKSASGFVFLALAASILFSKRRVFITAFRKSRLVDLYHYIRVGMPVLVFWAGMLGLFGAGDGWRVYVLPVGGLMSVLGVMLMVRKVRPTNRGLPETWYDNLANAVRPTSVLLGTFLGTMMVSGEMDMWSFFLKFLIAMLFSLMTMVVALIVFSSFERREFHGFEPY